MNKISLITDDEVKAFSKPTCLSEDLEIDFRKIFKQISFYKRDRFLKCTDEKAVFWNIGRPRIIHYTKNIDADTKDFLPYGEGEVNYYQSWILKQKYYNWARENGFAFLLNDLAKAISEYGIGIWKKYENDDGEITFKKISPKNIYWDMLAEDELSTPIIEKMILTEWEIRSKEDVWDNIDEAIEKADTEGDKYDNSSNAKKFKVYQRVGDFEGKRYKHIFVGEGESEVILYEEELKDDEKMYYFFNEGGEYNLMPTVGVYERLFQLQKEINELVNQNAVTRRITSTLLLRTNDPYTKGNILDGVEPGEIINSADLQEVQMSNRALTAFLQELQAIEMQADKLCNTPQVVTGESMPSGTPFRSTAVLSNTAKSAFRDIKVYVNEKVAKIMLDEMFPSLVKKWNSDELVEIAGDENDIREYANYKVKFKLLEVMKQTALQGVVLDQQSAQDITKKLRKDIMNKDKITEKIPKGFFNFKYGIRLNVTNENQDKAQKNDVYFNSLQMIQANPAIMKNKLFRQYLEDNGVPPFKATDQDVEDMQQAQGQPQAQPQPVGGRKDKLMGQVDSQ